MGFQMLSKHNTFKFDKPFCIIPVLNNRKMLECKTYMFKYWHINLSMEIKGQKQEFMILISPYFQNGYVGYDIQKDVENLKNIAVSYIKEVDGVSSVLLVDENNNAKLIRSINRKARKLGKFSIEKLSRYFRSTKVKIGDTINYKPNFTSIPQFAMACKLRKQFEQNSENCFKKINGYKND